MWCTGRMKSTIYYRAWAFDLSAPRANAWAPVIAVSMSESDQCPACEGVGRKITQIFKEGGLRMRVSGPLQKSAEGVGEKGFAYRNGSP